MSFCLTLSGTSSILESNFFPEINLNGDYMLGLISFLSYNSIPNIDETNNLLHYGDNKFIELPIGSYEIASLGKVINQLIKKKDSKDGTKISISTNDNTLKCIVKCTKKVYFNRPRSIGQLLGFKDFILEPNVDTTSNDIINILKVNCIRVECNITASSYLNGRLDHTIHEFFPNVPPGFKIIEQPKNIIYNTVTSQSIDNLTLRLLDQNNNLIDFRGENITVRIHLKRI